MIRPSANLAALTVLAGLVLAAQIGPAAGEPMPDPQRRLLDQLGQIQAAEALCDRYELDLDGFVRVLAQHRLDLTEPRHASYLQDRARHHYASLGRQPARRACQEAWTLYGPGGRALPDLLREK
jgi:hypothetical protein